MAKFIMAGPLQAIGFILLFAILSVFLPLMGLLGNAAVALLTLRMGWRRGLWVTLAASAGLGVLTLILQGSPLVGIASGVIQWLPMILLAALLGHTVSWSRIFQALLGFSVLALLLFHLNVGDPTAFWKGILGQLADLSMLPTEVSEADLKATLDQVAGQLAGAIVALLNISWILSLMLARHWQAMLYNPGGFWEELRNLQVGKLPALLLGAAIMVALITKQPIAIDMVLAGLAIFLFQGISLVHGTVALLQQPLGWLVGMYALLFLLPVQVGILLAAFGIIDSLADFRSQIKARKH